MSLVLLMGVFVLHVRVRAGCMMVACAGMCMVSCIYLGDILFALVDLAVCALVLW